MTETAPPKKHAIAFIDGQNLFRHAKEAFGYHFPNYDVKKLHAAVCAKYGWTPTLVRFYTGIPNAQDDLVASQTWSNHILAMKRNGIVVTTRALRYREREVYNKAGELVAIRVPQEKGIDLRIALDVVSCALGKQFDVGVIYSQDQDLNEIVEEISKISKQQSRPIELVSAFPFSSTASSVRGIAKTTWCKMDKDLYDRCLDNKDYRPKPNY